MIRRPPRSTRTDTLFPYTTLFRSALLKRCAAKGLVKIQNAPARRYAYYLTPKGFAEKSRLVAEYLETSLHFFRGARSQYEERSEEHTSELQSLMRISYAVFCLKKKKKRQCDNKSTAKDQNSIG